jgi:phospholipase/lecithinase/hemolysin
MSRTTGMLASAFTLLSGGVATAQQYSDVVVFGDSLSDNGNLFAATGTPLPPFWEGRETDGRVWVEQLANALGHDPDSISDFAVIGATTSDVFNLQVLPYVTSHGGVIPSDALYTVWAGPNDFLAFMGNPGGDPAQMITDAMNNLGSSIGLLLASGARHVIVPNLPDLTITPFITRFGDPVLSGQLLALEQAFNGAYAQVTGMLEAAYGVELIKIDAFSYIDGIAASPRSFDLKNSTDQAYYGELIGTTDVVKKPDDYLFFDDFHPTRVVHTIFASKAMAALGVVWGDLDGSGLVDSKDVELLVHSYGSVTGGSTYDLNADGVVDSTDLQLLQDARH